MSDITLKDEVVSDVEMNKQDLKLAMKSALSSEFKKIKFYEKDGILRFKCRTNSKLWNPIVSVKGKIDAQCKGKEGAVLIEGETKTNFWFWFTFLLGLSFPPLLVMMIFMWKGQKTRTIDNLKGAIDRLKFSIKYGAA